MKCYAVNDWDELEAVVLGSFMDPAIVKDVFDHSYFKPFIKYADRLAKETQEDLDNIQLQLENMGIKVLRPDTAAVSEQQLNSSQNLKFNLTKEIETGGIPQDLFMDQVPIPLAPRNEMMVYGDVIYAINNYPTFIDLNQFDNKVVNAEDHGWENLHWPAVTRVNDLLVFGNEFDFEIIEEVMKHAPAGSKYITTDIDGHVDASLACVREGLLLSTHRNPKKLYETTFPGWTCIDSGDNGFRHMCQQLTGHRHPVKDIIESIKTHGNGNWYIEGMENDPNIAEVGEIINTSLSNWFGYSEETYFEINCLTLNPNLSMVIGESGDMQKELAKHGHEVINVQWRNRWFFDQGLHCLTQDILRKKS